MFRFAVDIIGEYPTWLEPNPNGNPFESDGSLRVWFGGQVLDDQNEWTWEGLDGVMELVPLGWNCGECIEAQIEDNCPDRRGPDRVECVKEQISLCQGVFNIPSNLTSPDTTP